MRMFTLQRDTDISGVSGTGTVAEGIEFTDGTVVLRWLGETASTVVHENLNNVEKIHGHGGATRIEFIVTAPPASNLEIWDGGKP